MTVSDNKIVDHGPGIQNASCIPRSQNMINNSVTGQQLKLAPTKAQTFNN